MYARLLTLLPFAAAALWAAPEYSQRIWRIDDGLPQNRVRALAQTADGYLWVGTSEGLARFDGARFTVFDRSNTPQLTDDGILTLHVAANGTLLDRHRRRRTCGIPRRGLPQPWLGRRTDQRLCPNDFRRPARRLSGGHGPRLFSARRQPVRAPRSTPAIPHVTVPSMAEDENGRLQAVSPYGLLTMEKGHLTRAPPRCDTTDLRNLHKTASGSLWAVRTLGWGRLKDGCVETDPLLANVPLRTLIEDHEGKLSGSALWATACSAFRAES